MIPSSAVFDQSTMTQLLIHDPVVAAYRALFSLFDWSLVEHWQEQRSSRGRPPHPESAYLKAFLVRITQGLLYTAQLRDFLLKHPLLVIELGFHLELDPTAPYGFDVEDTLPCRYWFGEKLRHLDPTLLQDLLHATVAALQAEIPGLGETVAFDVKHMYAWVKENNERVYVKDRYDKAQRLAGDPDCKLGVKRSSNQEQPDGTTKQVPTGDVQNLMVNTFGCAGCHSLDDSSKPSYGPNLTHLASRTVFASGSYTLNKTNLVSWLLNAPGMIPMQSQDCRLPPSANATCVGMPSFTENTPKGQKAMTQDQAEQIADFLLGQT